MLDIHEKSLAPNRDHCTRRHFLKLGGLTLGRLPLEQLRAEQPAVVSKSAIRSCIFIFFHNVVDVPCQGGGFLGSVYDPLPISVDPSAGTYAVGPLALPADMAPGRLDQRRRLLDEMAPAKSDGSAVRKFRRLYGQAYDLLVGSDHVRKALDLSQEPVAVRERYGIYTAGRQVDDHTTVAGPGEGYGSHMRGQNLLLARRLVEAGVPFVNVYDYKQQGKNWDSHARNFEWHKRDLLPQADKALATLITDLDPVTPADLAATIFWRFGLDPMQHIRDRTSRPWTLADGEPIRRIFNAQ